MPAIIQQAQALLQKLAPPQPQDPTLAATAMQVQAKAASDASATARTQITAQSAEKRAGMQLQAKQQGDQLSNATKLQVVRTQTETELQTEREQMAARERINAADNLTAEQIAAAEIAADGRSNLSTGTGINKHEGA
jgi:hypothetical protein